MQRDPLNHRDVRLLLLISAVLILLLFSGCSTRLNQFKSFSEAGVAYSTAMIDFADAAGIAALDADSIILEKTRPAHNRSKRTAYIQEHNTLMEERLSILSDIKQHTLLLKAYFEALGALAGRDVGTQIASDTSGIVTELGKLSSRFANAKVGEASLSDLVEPVTGLVVKGIQQGALERELKTNAQVIAEELALQEAAVKTIAQLWQTDKLIALKHRRSLTARQYAGGGALPPNWADQRRLSLTENPSVALAESTSAVAADLKKTFVALVENRLTASDIPLLLKDINEVVTFLKQIEQSPVTST